MQKRETLLVLILTISFFVAGTVVAEDKPTPSGMVEIKSTSIAVGIGVTWGDGILKVEDQEYPFSVKGLSLVDLGVSSAEITGEVFDLKDVADFSGTYKGVKAGMAALYGGSDIVLKNDKDVKLTLQSAQEGVQLTVGGEGLKLELKSE